MFLCFFSLLAPSLSQPILPSPYYPGMGMEYSGFSPYGGYGNYGYSPYGMTHFGTQTTYQQPFNPYFPTGYGLGAMNQFGGGFYQAPLSYEVNGASNPMALEQAGFLSLVNDKDNFQPQGCGWDAIQNRCTDALGLCKGGCRDFATTSTLTAHDCRCIPYGYAALLKILG